jgi:Protein of unknown function (DUF4054)
MVATPRVSAMSLKLRFSEFAQEPDASCEWAIEEAARHVDDSWIAADMNLATSYLAAHFLMCSIQRRGSGTGQAVESVSVGPFQMSYQQVDAAKRADPDDFATTVYGSRYLSLLRLNKPPIAVV